ncbi:hypothetical protein L484_014676 [Morus notabilis]|uniref:Transposase (putative) gypsy type domain-containing protein n=1 Tax=Morus notabilis TaxID=981085 RepID=W9SC37_9ROSA|nr:hypothetical protein L484_014676 [Morus notabilis]
MAFALSVLENYHITIGQLMPNSWRVILGLVDLAEKFDVYLHDKAFLYLFYMKQNPDSSSRYMFVPRKKHVIAFEKVKSVDREWNGRYAMVHGVIDDVGSPWIAPTV